MRRIVAYAVSPVQPMSDKLRVQALAWSPLNNLRLELLAYRTVDRHFSASSTAFRGATTPQPCRSTATPSTRSAVSIRIRLIICGVSDGLASSIQATMEATIGDAKEVPSTNL